MSATTNWRAGSMCAVLLGCGGFEANYVNCPPSPWRSSPPLVIAHAGGEGLGPANTVVAMERSVDAGADVLDLDLRMTSDGVIVATHDRDLSTTTDGQGNVDETTWTEIQQLDAAVHWSGEATDAVRMPSLEEALERFPDELFSLELKQATPSLADELCAVLERTASLDRVFVASNTDDAVYAARDACPGLVITTTYADLDVMRSAEEGEPGWCAASPIGQPPYRSGAFDEERMARSHRQGRALFVWTVDDPEALGELAAAGVDGVYTRRPDIARAVFDEFAGTAMGS
ncbi:glycerophosphodiester phosphodiesterase [soil metagenome]